MKKFFHALWRLIRSNLLLKVMSVLFAVVLWSYVLADTNPQRETTMHDITVRYENYEDLTAKGLAISGSLSDVLNTVDIRVEVSQSELKYISDENVSAVIDLSLINGVGERTLRVTPRTEYGRVIGFSHEVTLYVDNLVTNTVPVNVKVTGTVPYGYYASDPKITPDVVSISGAWVDVEKVKSAEYTVDLTGLTQGVNQSVEVELLDDQRQPVDKRLFSGSVPSVILTMDVLAQKTVPVDAEGSVLGQDNLAVGYEITELTCEPATVQIVGEKSVLDAIDTIALVPYSVSGASADVVVPMDYDLPDGVSVIGEEKARVYIGIREVPQEQTYTDIDIQQKNLGSGLTAKLSQTATDVTVFAGISHLSQLDKSQIVPYVDLNDLEPGVHSVPVVFEIPEGFLPDNFTSSITAVTVTVRKQ